MDGGLVVKEHKDVVERRPQFVREHFQLHVILDHGQDVLLHNHQAFAGEPDDVVVKLEGLGLSGGIQPAQLSGTDELFRQDHRQAEDLVQHPREEGVVMAGAGGEVAQIFLVDVGGGHPHGEQSRLLRRVSHYVHDQYCATLRSFPQGIEGQSFIPNL